jgi:hypothetical protein
MPHECEPSSAALFKSDHRAGPGFRVGGFAAPDLLYWSAGIVIVAQSLASRREPNVRASIFLPVTGNVPLACRMVPACLFVATALKRQFFLQQRYVKSAWGLCVAVGWQVGERVLCVVVGSCFDP